MAFDPSTFLERPNTVSGLVAKRAELTRVLSQIKEDERRVLFDLAHIDAAIRLFDPKADHPRIDRYPAKFRAQRGEVVRLVARALKTANHPLTARDLVRQQMERRGLPDDHDTNMLLRRRVGVCLSKLKRDGFVRMAGKIGQFYGWEWVR